MSSITVSREDSCNYKIKLPCIGCGDEHIFIFSRKKVLSGGVCILYCPEKGIPQCVIGRDELVRKKVDCLEQELDELIDMFGYDSYFKNTQVMLDSLNRIHDIAEQGNLLCECGNDDIELILLSDRIYLKCRKCPGNIVISAATNEDLKDTLAKQYVLLSQEYSGYVGKRENPILRKTDGCRIRQD
jgi:hypothetical protein